MLGKRCSKCQSLVLYGNGKEVRCPKCGEIIFRENELYADAQPDQLTVLNPDAADQLMESLDYTDADGDNLLDKMFEEMCNEEDSLHEAELQEKCTDIKAADIGDLVRFGSIFWKVLDKKNDILLLISNEITNGKSNTDLFAVDKDHMDPSRSHTSLWGEEFQYDFRYRQSGLRDYLNKEFINASFSKEEREKIVPFSYSIINKNGIEETCQDKVFILNKDETLRYFPSSESRIGTFYNIFGSNYLSRGYLLRTTDERIYEPDVVRNDGEMEVLDEEYTVDWFRPVIQVKVD